MWNRDRGRNRIRPGRWARRAERDRPLQQTAKHCRNLRTRRIRSSRRISMYLVDGPNQKAYGECERRKEEANDAPADPVAPGVDRIDLGDQASHGSRLILISSPHPGLSRMADAGARWQVSHNAAAGRAPEVNGSRQEYRRTPEARHRPGKGQACGRLSGNREGNMPDAVHRHRHSQNPRCNHDPA